MRLLSCLVLFLALTSGDCRASDGKELVAFRGLRSDYRGPEPVQFEIVNRSAGTLKFLIEAEIKVKDGDWDPWPYRVEDNRVVKNGLSHQLIANGSERVDWKYYEARPPGTPADQPIRRAFRARIRVNILDENGMVKMSEVSEEFAVQSD
jgi:hypothetical protein